LKTAEALVSEEVNNTEGYRASLCCSGDVGGHPSEDDTSKPKNLSEVRRKQDSIQEKKKSCTTTTDDSTSHS